MEGAILELTMDVRMYDTYVFPLEWRDYHFARLVP